VAKLLSVLLKILSSPRLTLVLVALVIFFAVCGAMLPQEGGLDTSQIADWQKEHPGLSRAFGPLGLFGVFHSWPFIITLVLLALNTLLCTILRFVHDGGFASFTRQDWSQRAGFFILHISLIAIMASGFVSAATRFSARLYLTEGQGLKDDQASYTHISRGPLCRKQHKGFTVVLDHIQTEYVQGRYQTELASKVEFFRGQDQVAQGYVKINRPYTFEGLAYTLDRTGFSPRILIRQKGNPRTLVNSFVALQTFDTPQGRTHRDFLPLAFFKNRFVITLYPAHQLQGDEIKKTGENPDNPLILVEMEDAKGNVAARGHAPLKEKVTVGDYEFEFAELRQWASFGVSSDPGYPIIWISLWLGMAALILRYAPDLRKWFADDGGLEEKD